MIGLVCSSIISTGALQQSFWGGARMGMRAKAALSALLFEKTLKLDTGGGAQPLASTAAATTLLAVDVARLELAFMFFHFVWALPLQVLFCSRQPHFPHTSHPILPIYVTEIFLFCRKLVICGGLLGRRLGVAAIPGTSSQFLPAHVPHFSLSPHEAKSILPNLLPHSTPHQSE